jgi:hypothetical protein
MGKQKSSFCFVKARYSDNLAETINAEECKTCAYEIVVKKPATNIYPLRPKRRWKDDIGACIIEGYYSHVV